MKLLVYLLIHREQPVSVETLSEALWSEGETDNPAGALKNLMYRLRTILNKTFGADEYILTSRGIYGWNPEIKVQIDVEEFEKLCQKAKTESDSLKKINSLKKALALYQGDFMQRIMDRHWVMTLSTYYHSMLMSSIKLLSDLYMREERYEEVEHLCLESLKLDSLDEWLHCTLIRALIGQNQNKLAMEHYQEAVTVLREELGVYDSPQLEAVYKQLLQTNKGNEAEKIQNVSESVIEKGPKEGAYICGYPVFGEIYRIEARRMNRLGEAEYLVLLTLKPKDRVFLGEQLKLEHFLFEKAMKQLEGVLIESLRLGDVAARYSDSQFVILLPTCSYESCLLVAKRILARFEQLNAGKYFDLKVDYEEVKDTTTLIDGRGQV